jgi:hypothetical protein
MRKVFGYSSIEEARKLSPAYIPIPFRNNFRTFQTVETLVWDNSDEYFANHVADRGMKRNFSEEEVYFTNPSSVYQQTRQTAKQPPRPRGDTPFIFRGSPIVNWTAYSHWSPSHFILTGPPKWRKYFSFFLTFLPAFSSLSPSFFPRSDCLFLIYSSVFKRIRFALSITSTTTDPLAKVTVLASVVSCFSSHRPSSLCLLWALLLIPHPCSGRSQSQLW